MADAPDAWSDYLRRMTRRPGWSVARLAREAGLHRSTIFDWIRDGGANVTIASVHAVADALGDDRANAVRAAGNIRDDEVDQILAMPWTEEQKTRAIDRLMEQRAAERDRRRAELDFIRDNLPPIDEEDDGDEAAS